MTLDYQIVVQMMIDIMSVAFPVALIFMIVQKIVAIFTSFVFGKDVNF